MSLTIESPPSYETATMEVEQNHQDNHVYGEINDNNHIINLLNESLKIVSYDDNATETEQAKQLSITIELIQLKMNDHPLLIHMDLIEMIKIKNKLKRHIEIGDIIYYNEI
jgi:hypothetical protein